MVPLDLIVDDPDFVNCRLTAPADRLEALAESMLREGQKTPITLIPSADAQHFHVRAGFRRTTAARLLEWQKIAAIILPADTPPAEEYWTNVVENVTRDQLSTYEVARAAQLMRDKFRVSARDFAVKAGLGEVYVKKLLRCVDRLPDVVLTAWKEKAPIPVDMYYSWSALDPDEAERAMRSYKSRYSRVAGNWTPPEKSDRRNIIRMATSAGLRRMQKLRFAVETAPSMSERERRICVAIVDFCTGARDVVAEIAYDPKRRSRMYQSRRREDRERTLPSVDLSAVADGEFPDVAQDAARGIQDEVEKLAKLCGEKK
jgi:ParB/RepB/Spo0J family partition protein